MVNRYVKIGNPGVNGVLEINGSDLIEKVFLMNDSFRVFYHTPPNGYHDGNMILDEDISFMKHRARKLSETLMKLDSVVPPEVKKMLGIDV